MSSVFSLQDAQLLSRYWYQRTLYTYGPATLQPGPQPSLINVSGWNPSQSSPDWRVELEQLFTTQNASVQLSGTADGLAFNQGATSGFTDAGRAGVRRMNAHVFATAAVTLGTVNGSGAAINGFQTNLALALRRLTVADKLLANLPLAAEDEDILAMLPEAGGSAAAGQAAVQQLVTKGTSPIPIGYELERTAANRLLGDHPNSGWYHVTASASSAGTVFATFAPIRGVGQEWLVLREVAIEGAAAITLYGDQDAGNTGLLTINGAAFVQADDQPWDLWLPASTQWQFRAGAAATLNNVPVRIRVERYAMSDIWAVRLGLAKSMHARSYDGRGAVGATYPRVLAGIA